MRTTTFLRIRNIGPEDRDEADEYPVVLASRTFELESDEEIVWTFSAYVECKRDRLGGGGKEKLWRIPTPADVFVTNQRVVYLCDKFEKGSTWIGNPFISGALMAGSAVRAAARRRGRVAAGHVRYEWPLSVIESNFKLAMLKTRSVSLLCAEGSNDDPIGYTITFDVGGGDPAIVANDLVRRIAWFRLNQRRDGALAPEEREKLERHVAEPVVEGEQVTAAGRGSVQSAAREYRLPGGYFTPLR